jgi:isopentenyl-diphosphate delta-isomerase
MSTTTVEELFDVFDENEALIGCERRSVVHRTGAWHRSSNVLLFDADGKMLVQQRAAHKDVCPLHWDLSVAEHCKRGESYLDAAVRGVREELGLALDAARFTALRAAPERFQYQSATTQDNEFNVSFRVDINAAEIAAIRFDDGEVCAVDWLAPSAVKALQSPDGVASTKTFTPWMLREVALSLPPQ